MLRRDFLKGVSVLSASAIAPGIASAASSDMSLRSVFRSSFANVPQSFGPTQIAFDVTLPKELSGTLYRNGPALFERGPTQYSHWFDGDGMIQSFELSGKSLTHKAKMVQTDRHVAEQAAGRFLWPGFGSSFEGGRLAARPDDMNPANTSLLPVDDELWALWEGGSPWRVDPNSLDTLGRKVLSPETDGVSFSAHPKVDTDGRIWNFGYLAGSDTLVLYDMSPNGQLNRVSTINSPNTNMVHDFAVTNQYLVFVLLPITFNAEQANRTKSFSELIGWDAEQPVHVLVVNKSTLALEHRLEMPSFFAFHFGNAWEDGQQIRVQLATSDPWDSLNEQLLRATQGKALHNNNEQGENTPQAVELIIDLQRKAVAIDALPIIEADFPVFDERYTGAQTNLLTMLNRSNSLSNEVFGFNQLVQFNRQTGRTQNWDFGASTLAEEHVFVPKFGTQEGEGWLVGTAYNWKKQITSLSVFNANQLSDGPIATAELPYHLPLGFHGKFVAS